MTIRFYISLLYGAAALGVAAVGDLTGEANAARMYAATIEPAHLGRPAPLEEIEPGLSGHAEDDDLPAYLVADVRGGDDADL